MARGATVIVLFCMPLLGHFRRMRSLIARLARRGSTIYVFTDRAFRLEAEAAGGHFVDLFGKYPLEEADDESLPVPCRFVSFAGCYAEHLIEEVRALGASLVIYDTFAVIGPVVGRALGLPYINVCAGHAVEPGEYLPRLETDERVRVSSRCRDAASKLARCFGFEEASPFSYVSGMSPFLNIYCEPPQFLDEPRRRAFEPIVFYGSLPDPARPSAERPSPAEGFESGSATGLRAYVCFGTVIWHYYAREALAALRVIAAALDDRAAQTIISLGGARVDPSSRTTLARGGVRVLERVDQWSLLPACDVFITHHGLNSTHEAIFHRVAMISYPFFWDQPALARRCAQLGLAIPLAEAPREPLSVEAVHVSVERLLARRDRLREQLARAREWELEVMAGRDEVIERILERVAPR